METKYYFVNNDGEIISRGFETEEEAERNRPTSKCYLEECSAVSPEDVPRLTDVEETFWNRIVNGDDCAMDLAYTTSREQAEKNMRETLYGWAKKHMLIVKGEA